MLSPRILQTPTVGDLGERELIARITAKLAAPPWVVVGPGDDAAVIKPARGMLEVLTTDAQIEGVHFDRRFLTAAAIGHRALAVNLSDLAAMGAEPRAALLSLALPPALDASVVEQMIDGLLQLASEHRVAVIGGNITRTPGPLMIDITAIGSVRPRRYLTRRGARPGDEVYVTGSLGDAVVGLRSLQRASAQGADGQPSEAGLDAGPYHRCEERYRRPDARVRAGLQLSRNRAASSCMDLSDGLADGVRQISEASGVGITIEASALPITDEVRKWHEDHGGSAIDTAVAGGDDYELLFTVKRTQIARFRGARKQLADLPITRIGVVTRARDILLQDATGTRALPAGFDHFR